MEASWGPCRPSCGVPTRERRVPAAAALGLQARRELSAGGSAQGRGAGTPKTRPAQGGARGKQMRRTLGGTEAPRDRAPWCQRAPRLVLALRAEQSMPATPFAVLLSAWFSSNHKHCSHTHCFSFPPSSLWIYSPVVCCKFFL